MASDWANSSTRSAIPPPPLSSRTSRALANVRQQKAAPATAARTTGARSAPRAQPQQRPAQTTRQESSRGAISRCRSGPALDRQRTSEHAGRAGCRTRTPSYDRSSCSSAGGLADRALGDQVAGANALLEEEKRREEVNDFLDEAEDKVRELRAEEPNFEERAATDTAFLEEASATHAAKMLEMREREATMIAELEKVRHGIAAGEKLTQQLKAGSKLKQQELQKITDHQNKIKSEEAARLAECDAKVAKLDDISAAIQQSKADIARRNEIHGESVMVARQIHNEYLNLKGNIRVFCRLRPRLPRESDDVARIDITECSRLTVRSETTKSVTGLTDHTNSWDFNFDHVFAPESSQEEVFEEIGPLVQSALDGYKVAIFAYGQTGGGKTHTMDGPPIEYRNDENAGLIPRTVDLIFAEVHSMREKGWNFEVQCTAMEVYNESVRDLLVPVASSSDTQPKSARGGRKDCRDGWLGAFATSQPPSQEAAVGNGECTARRVDTAAAVHTLLRRTAKERRTAATLSNDRSSRSHAIFQLQITGRREAEDRESQEIRGLLSLVDLAGSERVERSGASGDRLKEAQYINRSLSALGDVVEALARRKQGGQSSSTGHVPYRNSKLTMLLKDSLGGESKALMFVNISPCLRHLGETISSLRFASKVHACNVGIAKRHAEGMEPEPHCFPAMTYPTHTAASVSTRVPTPVRSGCTATTTSSQSLPPASWQDQRSRADRLRELQQLRDDGLVTEREFQGLRKQIVASV